MSANRLSREISPYLQQHAGNPVDWYPWGDEALNQARELDKPILLSIGYSACHWCHVMAHESFEDDSVAKLMNQYFVNIKVDREERPDLDHIYQTAHALLTGRHGGWPLTMFLTPQQQPFFGGTYFPKQARYTLPGFTEILPRVAAFYHEHRAEIERQGAELAQAFARTMPENKRGELDDAPLVEAMRALSAGFDELHGGFGNAPKFPHPAELELCLREAVRLEDTNLAHMTLHTLERMACGGIYDQLGGGFFRYSVDERWEIPHFEKMLYDNAQLLPLYADAWQLTRNPLFKRIVEETAGWVVREMQSPEGGYYSTLDADSEHEEGKYYVWRRDEIRGALDAREYTVCEMLYGLDGQPNFEGRWHLRESRPLDRVAIQLGYGKEVCRKLLDDARAKLLAVREKRVRPGRDDKILTAWNGLMIKGMARAARIFDREDWLRSARAAAEFIRNHMWHNSRLCAVNGDKESGVAYLDDYAFMLEALLELLQAEFKSQDLGWGRELVEVLLVQFQDTERGDLFFTANNHEPLIYRPKPVHDNATPNGNAVAVHALQRLSLVLGEPRYAEVAQQILRLYSDAMHANPSGFATMLMALQEYIRPPILLILRGEGSQLAPWHAVLREINSHEIIYAVLQGEHLDLPVALAKPYTDEPRAWLCDRLQCFREISDYSRLRNAIMELGVRISRLE